MHQVEIGFHYHPSVSPIDDFQFDAIQLIQCAVRRCRIQIQGTFMCAYVKILIRWEFMMISFYILFGWLVYVLDETMKTNALDKTIERYCAFDLSEALMTTLRVHV